MNRWMGKLYRFPNFNLPVFSSCLKVKSKEMEVDSLARGSLSYDSRRVAPSELNLQRSPLFISS